MNNEEIDILLKQAKTSIDKIPDHIPLDAAMKMVAGITRETTMELLAEICKRLPEPKE